MKRFIAGCIPIYLLLASCSGVNEQNIKREKYPVTTPIVIDTVYYKEYVAEITSLQNVEIRARVKGFIEQILVDEGKPVKAGQVLFRISSQEYKEALAKANARLNIAKAEARSAALDIENTKILLEKKIVSETELKAAHARHEGFEAKIEEARSEVSEAALKLSLADVKAPFDGVINRIPNKKGSLVDEGTLLTSISDNHEVFAYFNVSEKEYLEFTTQEKDKKHAEVTLLLANNQPHPSPGTIETIEGEFDKATGNIAFRARFSNPGLVLKHGATGKVRLRKEVHNALIVPQKSTFEVQEKTYVYVLDTANAVQLRSIVPLLRLPQIYVLESGLLETDTFIYEGIQNLREGDLVIPEPIPIKKIIAGLSEN